MVRSAYGPIGSSGWDLLRFLYHEATRNISTLPELDANKHHCMLTNMKLKGFYRFLNISLNNFWILKIDFYFHHLVFVVRIYI